MLLVHAYRPVYAVLEPVCWFADSMVVQRNKPIPVWGWADIGDTITVTCNGLYDTTVADTAPGTFDRGMWHAVLDSMPAGGPYDMTITGPRDTVVLHHVLAGDVWVCAGQSNMEIGCANALQDMTYPEIRLFTVSHAASNHRVLDLKRDSSIAPGTCHANDRWRSARPATCAPFSRVGFVFGRDIHTTQQVPVGLIDIAVGGTSITSWHAWGGLYSSIVPRDSTCTYPGWRDLFRGHIHPMTGLGIRGMIWWQGENDATWDFRNNYSQWFHHMICDWRARWGYPFAFLHVQLQGLSGTEIMNVRDAQLQALMLPNTAMATIADTSHGIHPQQRNVVGHRLARAARAVSYEEDIVPMGPLPARMHIRANQARIFFTHTADGLYNKRNGMLSSTDSTRNVVFEAAGIDSQFMPAHAWIEGKTVVVSHPMIDSIAYVRYGWSEMPQATILRLMNSDSLPASPFWAPLHTSPAFFTGYEDSTRYPEDTTAPSPPAFLHARTEGSRRVVLQWGAATDSESVVTHFIVYRDGDTCATAYTPYLVDTAVAPSHSYTYRVTAVNMRMRESAPSEDRTISVPADTTAPWVQSISRGDSGLHLTLTFSERVTSASAGDTATYALSDTGISVVQAVLQPDSATVRLTLSDTLSQFPCSVSVYTVADRAPVPNILTHEHRLLWERDTLYAAFAFGRTPYTAQCAADESVSYIKIHRDGPLRFDFVRGYGYIQTALDSLTFHNRGRSGCELLDQHIGVSAHRSARFRMRVPAGTYRFVAVCGDAQTPATTTLRAFDPSRRDTVTLIDSVTTLAHEYALASFGDTPAPQCRYASYRTLRPAPALTVTGGAIDIIQTAHDRNSALNLVQIWKMGKEQAVGLQPPRARTTGTRAPQLHIHHARSHSLAVTVHSRDIHRLVIFTMQGAVVASRTGNENARYRFSPLPGSGVYGLHLQTERTTLTRRIIVR
jgi:sialate O-acetylesterase